MHKVMIAVLLAAVAAGCSSNVKQQRPPRIEDEDETAAMGEGEDMAPQESTTLEPVKEKKITPEEQKGMCCTECEKARQNDRSGDDPTKIPCVDFTADLTPKCLKWFRKNPIMASEAAACAAPPAEAPAADAGGEGGEAAK